MQVHGKPANLFEVGELNQLHSHLCVLELHSFAHTGLGMGRGQTDQSLQSPDGHRGGLVEGEKGHILNPRRQINSKNKVTARGIACSGVL